MDDDIKKTLEELESAHPVVEPNERKSSSQAQRLVAISRSSDVLVFRNQLQEAYARVLMCGQHHIIKCRSEVFQNYLMKMAYEAFDEIFSADAINRCISLLCANARFDGEQYELHNRVALADDSSRWYDLTDHEGNAVKITHSGWEIVKTPPILFAGQAHQRPQVLPSQEGDIRALLKYLNISDRHQQCLLLVSLVAAFIEEIPHPIIVIHGEKGSAKSSALEILRASIDPSVADLLTLSRNVEQLIQTIFHHWFPCFDNISHISHEVSDTLCRAVTGLAHSKRRLYTDDEDHFVYFKRPIGMNGVNLEADKSDLLDRCLIFELQKVPACHRKEKAKLFVDFRKDLPSILGGVFDTLSKAMSIHPSVELKSMPRMADFARWGVALAIALGYSQTEFLEAYEANISLQNEQSLQESPVALSIIALMRDHDHWEGTATALLQDLTEIVENEKITNLIKSHSWPQNASNLSKKINEVKGSLESAGIVVEKLRPTSSTRLLRITKDVSLASPPSQDSPKIVSDTDRRGLPSSEISQIFPGKEANNDQ